MRAPAPEVTVLRLNILRGYYALMAFGSLAVFWPPLLSHGHDWGIRNGAQYALLGALAPLALLGLRHPLKMLPLVFYEFAWKALWFLLVVAPLHVAGQMTEAVWSNVFACSIAILLTPIVVPWRHVWRVYLSAPGDPWRPRG